MEEVGRHAVRDHRRRHHRRARDEGGLAGPVNAMVLGLFVLLLALSPLPMGANRDWAWSPIVVVIAILAVLCGLFSGARGGFEVTAAERRPLIWLFGAFGFFLFIALLQMLPFAPATPSATIYARAREILGQAHAAVPSLSIDASVYTLLRCLACALVFLTARALCRDAASARLLMLGLLVSAIVVVGYGMYMQVTTQNCYVGSYLKKEGEFNPGDSCLMSGTFVGPNNFACYLGMAVVAAVALLLGDFSGEHRRRRRHRDEDDDEEEEAYGYRRQWLTGGSLAYGAIAVLCTGGILISGSRAGFVATAGGVLLFGYLLARGRRNTGVLMRRTALASLVVGLVVLVIAGNSLLRKTFEATQNYNRVIVWKTSLKAVRDSPLLGWGLGSYTDVYNLYQPPEIILTNDKAHSTPLELTVELGIPGSIAANLLVLIPWLMAWRAAIRSRHRAIPAAAFAVAAVPILHSTIDFSLQMPAIGFMTSAFLGVGWAHAFAYPQEPERDDGFTEDT